MVLHYCKHFLLWHLAKEGKNMTQTTTAITGSYRIENSKLHNQANGLILHLRERKYTSGKPKQFLAIHKPTYEYISSLYPKAVFTGEADGKPVATSKLYELDYKGVKHTLSITGNTATISEAQ